ncbi:MAG: TolC family protein [Rubrivivax sp.]|nr:TolC family protein [Rubrivivax sp.]
MRTPPVRSNPVAAAFFQVLVLAASCLLPAGAWAQCLDESRQEADTEAVNPTTVRPVDPRQTLQTLVRDALERSHQVGAAKLVAEAAVDEIAETRAGKAIQASANAGLGSDGAHARHTGTESSVLQLRASITASQLLYDGGRTDRLTDWRTQLAESARHGHLTAREQLALSTVSLALERSRYRQHVVVYSQYVRKMNCLVEALGHLVRADRGRASELVQARKSLQQAELSFTQAQSQARQVETRLRRLVGDGLPGSEGLAAVLLSVPELNELVAEVERSSEIASLTAQAAALDHYARSVAAGSKPQLSWNVSGSAAVAAGGTRTNTHNGSLAVGVALNIPLMNPGVAPATDAARKRAQAASLQRAEALEARRYRVAEVHEQTLSSFDRARRVGAVLRDSEQVRNFTLQQWQQLGKRSLFDVMGAEGEHYNLRISYVNALHDGQQLNANLLSLGRGVTEWLR